MQKDVKDIAREIIDYLQEVPLATTSEIGLHLIARQDDPQGFIPSRQQLEIILESMTQDKQLVKIKRMETQYFPEGFEITEKRMRSQMWRLNRTFGQAAEQGAGAHAASA